MPAARQARIAGLCYFLVIAGGVFAALFVRESLFVSGDAAATTRNIAANESLWRWGIGEFSLATWLAIKGVKLGDRGMP